MDYAESVAAHRKGYLEPISEEEWASIVEHLPDCVSVGNAKQAWEKELKQ